MKTKSIYFLGMCHPCEIVSLPKGRYLCTSEGYDIYDPEEYDQMFLAVKV